MNFGPFSSVPVSQKRRTNFNESHSLSGTFPLSKVCPVCFLDSLPGSSWNINVYNLTKLETLIAPAMQRMDASLLWFKMPKRLVFKHFKKWYSGGDDGKDDHQKPHTFITKLGVWMQTEIDEDNINDFTNYFFGPGSLWNYMGLPCPLYYTNSTGVWNVLSADSWSDSVSEDGSDFIDLMPIIAYNYLYDTYFRDQSLSNSIFEDSEEGNFTISRPFVVKINHIRYYFGPEYRASEFVSDYYFYTSDSDISEGGYIKPEDVFALLNLFTRAWRKEYFTSALPSPQRGPEVQLNLLSGNVPVDQDDPFYLESDSLSGVASANVIIGSDTSDRLAALVSDEGHQLPLTMNKGGEGGTGLSVDLSGLSPISIVAMRNLFKLQSFLEKNNVSGGRYIESILAHWGERVPDFTVQRPQFIRATSIPVQIMEVTATANSAGVNSLVGDQGGRARSQGNLGRVHIYTQEPSFIFGLYCVTAPPSYAGQGIPRIFQHKTRFDEPWTEFQHIGEQAVKTRELYFDFAHPANNDSDFGYQQRYSEYKYIPDRVVGYFQTSLAYWHMARMFNEQPTLNHDFVTQHLDPRIFAVQNTHPVTADFYFDCKAKIKLSKYSTPKLS